MAALNLDFVIHLRCKLKILAMRLTEFRSSLFTKALKDLPDKKLLINTINAYSFVTAKTNKRFQDALAKSDILLPDGVSIVWASKFLFGESIKKIAGFDLFTWEMKRLNKKGGKCFFLGSSPETLTQIRERAKIEFPNVRISFFSPPYKSSFNEQENQQMVTAVNEFSPDVLFVGMTAPKQETWASNNLKNLKAGHICCIGAVFDFYAGTIKRSPAWMINSGCEWLYRLVKEPKRMWRRYLVGNPKFIYSIVAEKAFYRRQRTNYNITDTGPAGSNLTPVNPPETGRTSYFSADLMEHPEKITIRPENEMSKH